MQWLKQRRTRVYKIKNWKTVADHRSQTLNYSILMLVWAYELKWFLFICVCAEMLCACAHLTNCEKCVLSSHQNPSALALSRRRGERSGQGQSRPFRLPATVSSFGQGKQTCLAPGQRGLSGMALPGQGKAWDRTEWDGRPLIDVAHYFHPRKLGQLQTERCHSNWAMGSKAEGFHPH